jgi:hypothetical protein
VSEVGVAQRKHLISGKVNEEKKKKRKKKRKRNATGEREFSKYSSKKMGNL